MFFALIPAMTAMTTGAALGSIIAPAIVTVARIAVAEQTAVAVGTCIGAVVGMAAAVEETAREESWMYSTD